MHFSNCFFRFPCAKVMCFSAVCPSLQLRFPGASGLLFSYSPTRSRSESFPFCSRNIEKASLRFNIFSLCIYILFFEKFVFLLSFILLYHPPKLCYSNCGKETLVPNPFLIGVSLTEPLQTGALLPDGASVSPQKAWRKPCFFPFRGSSRLRFIYCYVPCNAKYFVIYYLHKGEFSFPGNSALCKHRAGVISPKHPGFPCF